MNSILCFFSGGMVSESFSALKALSVQLDSSPAVQKEEQSDMRPVHYAFSSTVIPPFSCLAQRLHMKQWEPQAYAQTNSEQVC